MTSMYYVTLEETRITSDASDVIHTDDVPPALEQHRREREACRFDDKRWGRDGREVFSTEHVDRSGNRFLIESEPEYPMVTVMLPSEVQS